MSITQVIIRNFKRFREETFELNGDVVIAGPNNCGKTTLLQAIATWALVLDRWSELDNYHRRGGSYEKAPIARQDFYPVPLRVFDWLWHEREDKENVEIEVTYLGVAVGVEVIGDSSEQVYVRPSNGVAPQWLREYKNPNMLSALPNQGAVPLFIPSISALSIEEPVYQQPKIQQLLGQGKSGDVLRNLLLQIHEDQQAWDRLQASIAKMFGYELLPPNARGASIRVEYKDKKSSASYDVSSAGSGFLQVLMLLTFLNSRPGSVLLLDEPDAHLHLILQDRIYSELRTVARQNNSQLIIATHSEVVINAVDPRNLCALLDKPINIAGDLQKADLITSLSVLSNTDITLALQKEMILYLEGHTDLAILQAWATTLDHPLSEFLQQPFWKPTVADSRDKGEGIKAQDHFKALALAVDNVKGAQIMDRDGHSGIPLAASELGGKLLKLCWTRYEIENYLVHPEVLARFVAKVSGGKNELADVEAMREKMLEKLPREVVDTPLRDSDMLISVKMRKSILPSILESAGIYNFAYTRYAEIAAVMQKNEIPADVNDKLDAIAKHFEI